MKETYDGQSDSDLIVELTVCMLSIEDMLNKENHIIDITFIACLLCACLNIGTEIDVENEDSFDGSETDINLTLISDMIIEEKIEDLKIFIEKKLADNNRFEVIIELKKEKLI